MHGRNFMLGGASLALVAFVAACDAPSSTQDEPAAVSRFVPSNFVVSPVQNGTLWACKFTVNPVSGDIVGDFSSGAVTASLFSGAGTVFAGPQTISWPSGTQCVKVWEGAGAAEVDVTETPDAGFALSYYKVATPGDPNPFGRIYVNADQSPSPTGATVRVPVTGDGQYEVWFKNVPYEPPTTGEQGCTPGYWKQPQHFDSWTGYSTGDSFNTVFGGTYFSPDITLLQALGRNGGGINALARHSVAALLNASSPGVAYPDESTASIILAFQTAVEDGRTAIEMQKNAFDAWNNGGCPLN